MGVNPLFFIIKEECVSLVQRLFNTYRWLRDENGEIELNSHLDISEYFSDQSFSIQEERTFEKTQVLLHLPSLLVSNQAIAIYNIHYSVRKEDEKVIIKSSEGKETNISMDMLFIDFIRTHCNNWTTQYGVLPSSLFFVIPDYFSEKSIQFLEDCGKKCSFQTVSAFRMSSLISDMRDYLYVELSPSCISVTQYRNLHSSTQIIPLSQSSDPLQTIVNQIIEQVCGSDPIPSSQDRTTLVTDIYLQLQESIVRSASKLPLLLESSTEDQILFAITLPHYLHKHTFPVTLSFLQQCISSCVSYTSLIKASLQLHPRIAIVLDGFYSSIHPLMDWFRNKFSSVKIGPPIQHRIRQITETLNLQFHSICNDFSFLDHNISTSIQDGFALILLKRDTPLPVQTSSSMFFTLSPKQFVTVNLLRGDSYRQEDTVPLTSIFLDYTPAQQAQGGVEIRLSVLIDKECNLNFTVVDSFDHKKGTHLSSYDYFNKSSETSIQNYYLPPQPPICSRLTHSYYQGEMMRGRAEGFGRLFDVHNQLKYEGMWKDGLFHGKGTFYYDNGNVYEGSFSKGCLNQQGVLYDRLGIVIQQGPFDHVEIDPSEQEKKDSLIPMESTEAFIGNEDHPSQEEPSNHYEGERVNGIPCGFGTLYDPQGNKVYEGKFDYGVYQGEGSLYYPNGVVKSKGTFVRGELSGFGIQYSESGNPLISGNFLHNKATGKCTCYYDVSTHNIQFEGSFLEGKKEGYGRKYSENGDCVYRGYYYHDKEWDKGLVISLPHQRSTTLWRTSGRSILGRKSVDVAMNCEAVIELMTIQQSQTSSALKFFILHSIILNCIP